MKTHQEVDMRWANELSQTVIATAKRTGATVALTRADFIPGRQYEMVGIDAPGGAKLFVAALDSRQEPSFFTDPVNVDVRDTVANFVHWRSVGFCPWNGTRAIELLRNVCPGVFKFVESPITKPSCRAAPDLDFSFTFPVARNR